MWNVDIKLPQCIKLENVTFWQLFYKWYAVESLNLIMVDIYFMTDTVNGINCESA